MRSAVRMNTSNDTSALTGLPGSVTDRCTTHPGPMLGCIVTLTNSTVWFCLIRWFWP